MYKATAHKHQSHIADHGREEIWTAACTRTASPRRVPSPERQSQKRAKRQKTKIAEGQNQAKPSEPERPAPGTYGA